MTLSSTVKSSRHTGTGSNDTLAAGFNCFASSEVEVWKITRATGVHELLTEDTEYDVTLTVPSGTQAAAEPSVGVLDGATDFPSTVDWEIRRVMPLTQTLDLAEGDALPAISVEGALDRQAMHAHQLNKWVLLAEDSGAGATDLVVSSTASQGWPDLYDAVRLEFYGVFPSAAARIRVKLDDNGSEQTSGLYGMTHTSHAFDDSVSVASGTSWSTALSPLTVGPDLVSAVNGAITFHYRSNGHLYGFGQYTYVDATEGEMCGVQAHFSTATTTYTRLDGFYIDGSGVGTTVTGLARMFGLPKA